MRTQVKSDGEAGDAGGEEHEEQDRVEGRQNYQSHRLDWWLSGSFKFSSRRTCRAWCGKVGLVRVSGTRMWLQLCDAGGWSGFLGGCCGAGGAGQVDLTVRHIRVAARVSGSDRDATRLDPAATRQVDSARWCYSKCAAVDGLRAEVNREVPSRTNDGTRWDIDRHRRVRWDTSWHEVRQSAHIDTDSGKFSMKSKLFLALWLS